LEQHDATNTVLLDEFPVLLGKNLVGVYVYGSLTQNAFNPKDSDIDCIVVTNRELSDAQFRRLGAWLARAADANRWAARLQITFLIKNEILTMSSKGCLFQFGRLERSGSDGNPIIWMNVLKSGLVLYGPRPESFVPAITPEILFEALERRDVEMRRQALQVLQVILKGAVSFDPYAPEGMQLEHRRSVLSECEQTMARLAADPHYFARPDRTLFQDIRRYFPITAQAQVAWTVREGVSAAVTFIDAQIEAGAFDGGVARCRATTRKGKACQRTPLPNRDYCPSHQHLERSKVAA
jgi:hypothetical protein